MSLPDHTQPVREAETLAEKTERLLEQQLDLSIGISGLIAPETAEAIYNLACAYRELTKDED